MKFEIIYEYDSELDDWEALNKGYRSDVYVIYMGKKYKLYVTTITRLKQDVETEFEYNGKYQDEPNTVIVKEVSKETIQKKVGELIACHYFDEILGERC